MLVEGDNGGCAGICVLGLMDTPPGIAVHIRNNVLMGRIFGVSFFQRRVEFDPEAHDVAAFTDSPVQAW